MKYLEQHGCNCAERIFEKAQREQGFYIDCHSQIEIKLEESLVYIKMENQSPYFAAFQILSMGNVEDKGYKGPR